MARKTRKWEWKGHTSSDELCSTFFAHAVLHEVIEKDRPDVADRIATLVRKIMDHIVDNDLNIIAAKGNKRMIRNQVFLVLVTGLFAVASCTSQAAEPDAVSCSVRLTVTSALPSGLRHIPMDPEIDFGALIRQTHLPGVLDPNSIEVLNVATDNVVPHARTEDFAYGDKGRIQWVVESSAHKEYEIRFKTVQSRPALIPLKQTSMIGIGDLLRYNAGQPRPIVVIYPARLIDLTGDGKRDLVGCWNYAHDPAFPWDGIFCYPRVGSTDNFEFGDQVRIRYVDQKGSKNYKFLSHVYMHTDFADFNKDGLVDFVYFPHWSDNTTTLFLNSGTRDAGGMPVFVKSFEYKIKATLPPHPWMRTTDLDNDGAMDILMGLSGGKALYLRNTNPAGWPATFEEEATIEAGGQACFFDVNGDDLLDSVCLVPNKSGDNDAEGFFVAWRENLGGAIPTFAPPLRLKDIDPRRPSQLAAVNEGPRKGIFVLHDIFQISSFFEHVPQNDDPARFEQFAQAESISAVMSLGDQASPCICDWDNDGDQDLLVGGGYGYPRILINRGSHEKPAFDMAQFILSEGKPIRILRDEVLGGKHPHNMGYLFPVFADWDMDGLNDLVISNETNRIFWYKNIGTQSKPAFGPRLQILVDGFPDSPAMRLHSNRIAADYKNTKNAPYPLEKNRPFSWRNRVSIVDLNGDGLLDLIAHDSVALQVRLFERYRHADGNLRLRQGSLLKMVDGQTIGMKSVLKGETIANIGGAGVKTFSDWDGDGLLDIIYSFGGWRREGSLFLLRNCGTRTEPLFEASRPIECFGEPIFVTRHGPHPSVGDLNGDGKPDILCYSEWSVYPFYSHAALTMEERPKYRLNSPQRLQGSAKGGIVPRMPP